jgi:FKBP-type peptidyl-prolyl cis-trans isomerase (trigger factor)
MPLTDIAKSFALKNLPDSEVELVGEVPHEAVASYRDEALKHMAEQVEMPGFRPGKVPPEMVLKKVGEAAVLEDAVEHFMQGFYPVLIETHKIDAVGRPDIAITKLAPGNPVGLTIRAAVYPEVKLPKNWKTIGEKIPVETAQLATEEEVNQTIESLRASRAPKDADSQTKPQLPELNDEFAKSLGAFETVDALKDQIRKGISEEKDRAAKDQRRGKIIDALLEQVEIGIPRVFVESELEKIISQLKEDIMRFKIPYEDYLKQIGKTEEALRDSFREQARKRAKLQLTLNKIADEEKIEADKEAVEGEIKHALEHFPDANPELVGIHVSTVLRNEKVLRMLEGNTDPIVATSHDHEH